MASISKHNLSTRIGTLTGHTHELIDEQLDHITKLEDRLNQHSDNSYPMDPVPYSCPGNIRTQTRITDPRLAISALRKTHTLIIPQPAQ